jgi:hypothetical protein
MTTVLALAALALVDTLLAGFRAAAGRDGRIAKAPYYRVAIARSAPAGVALVAVNAALVAVLVATAPDRAAAWDTMLRAGAHCVTVFGAFATLTLIAIAFWLVPHSELRLLPTLLVLGPLTLVRPTVIVAGLLYVAIRVPDARVWAAAVAACVSMLGIEHVLGRRYADRWLLLL